MWQTLDLSGSIDHIHSESCSIFDKLVFNFQIQIQDHANVPWFQLTLPAHGTVPYSNSGCTRQKPWGIPHYACSHGGHSTIRSFRIHWLCVGTIWCNLCYHHVDSQDQITSDVNTEYAGKPHCSRHSGLYSHINHWHCNVSAIALIAINMLCISCTCHCPSFVSNFRIII